MRNKNNLFTFLVILFLLGSVGYLIYFQNSSKAVSEEVKNLALCLKEKGVTMYGTYYCSYCDEQKKMFGDAFKHINYVECTKETKKCIEARIRGVPTWVFSDEKILSGLQSFESLKKAAGCR